MNGHILFALSLACTLAARETPSTTVLRLPKELIPSEHASDIGTRSRRLILKRFLELHPDVRVESASGIDIGGGTESGLLMQLASGLAPHVILTSFRSSRTFTEEGFYQPLDDLVAEEFGGSENLLRSLHPALGSVIRHKGPPDGDEHVFLMPVSELDVMGLIYRKDLFRKCGLDPDRPPRTWDEFYAYAQAMTDPAKGTYGFGSYQGGGCAWHFVNFIFQAGGRVVEEQGDGSWRAVYNSPAGVEALSFFHKLLRGPWTRDGRTYEGVMFRGEGSDLAAKLMNGQLGMFFDTVSGDLAVPSRSHVAPDLIGFAPLPQGPSRAPATMMNCQLMGICSLVKDAATRRIAWAFIRHLMSDEAHRIQTELFVREGFGHYINPVYLRRFGFEKIARSIDPESTRVLDEAIRSGVPEPYGRKCQTIYDELAMVLDKAALSPSMDYKAELDAAVTDTNERLLGYVPPDVMSRRRLLVGGFVALLMLIMAIAVVRLVRIFRTMAREDGAPQADNTSAGSTRRRTLYAWAFMLPALACVLVWSYYPIGRGLLMAFQEYHILLPKPFNGVDNFIEVLWEPRFWIAVKNTAIYVTMTLVLGFFAPMILALILNEIPRGSLFFRLIYYLPHITSPMVVMLLWKQFYAPAENGFLNQLLIAVGLPAQKWLEDPNLAMACVIIPGIWAGVGGGAILYLAALKNVPDALYEAASLDGAGLWQKIRHVTFPTLKVLIIINFVGAFIGAFHATDRILVMTNGGPLLATHVLGLEIFQNAFVYLRFGYATAVAWILGSVLIGFTIYQLQIIRRIRFSTAERD